MNIYLIIITGIFLALFSYLDIKKRQVPSILSTTLILALGILNFPSIEFGVLAFIFAYLLWEFRWEVHYIRGILDIKAIVIVGLMLASLSDFITMMITLVLLAIPYELFCHLVLKIKEEKDIPFVPVIFLTYIILMFIIYI